MISQKKTGLEYYIDFLFRYDGNEEFFKYVEYRNNYEIKQLSNMARESALKYKLDLDKRKKK